MLSQPRHRQMIGYLVIFASLLCAVLAQILFKSGVDAAGGLAFDGSILGNLVRLVLKWQILFGLGTYIVGWLLWMNALSRFELSFVYPFTSLNYVMILTASWLLLDESLSSTRILGVALICGGIVLSARG